MVLANYVVTISGFRPGARRIWAARTIRDRVGLDLTSSKRMVEIALAGGLVQLEVPTACEARLLATELQGYNFEASVK